MGEAKRRGTLEKRQAEGREKRERLEQARRELLRMQEAARTPEERAAIRRAQLTLAMMLGMTSGSGYLPHVLP